MSRGSWDGLPGWRVAGCRAGRGAIAALALLLAAGPMLAGPPDVAAQATPEVGIMASPAAGPCEAPEPMLAMAATPLASPAAEEAAPAGTPVTDQALAAEAVAAVENFVNCWNAGDLSAVFALVTPALLQTELGVGDAAAAQAILENQDLPLFTILETGDVQTHDDGRVSVHVVYLLGEHQYSDSRWYFVEADDHLLLDDVQQLRPQPEGDTAVVRFAIADDTSPVAFEQSTEIPATDVVILYGANNGAERHIFTVVRLPEGMAGTPEPGALPPADAEFVGRISLAPGEQQELALVNLPPGTYAVFDPAVEGSVATLTITEPAA